MRLRCASPATWVLGAVVAALGCTASSMGQPDAMTPPRVSSPAASGSAATMTAPTDAPAGAPGGPGAVSSDAADVVNRLIDAHIEFLSSDDLGGRETGTVQSLITAQYVAAAFRAAGLTPAGEQGWFQSYPMEANRLLFEDARFGWRDESGRETWLELFDDYLLGGFASEGFEVTGQPVFVGYGLVDADAKVDDYAGLDVTGRVVVVLDGRPGDRADLRRASSSRSKRAAAKDHGAVGMIVLTDDESSETRGLLGMLENRMRNPTLDMPPEERETAWPLVALRPAASRGFAGKAGLDLVAERAARTAGSAPGRPLAGLIVELSARVDAQRTHAQNILGLLRGTDPKLRDEVVIVSAHNDHIGIEADGTVNNGADDNGSGTTTLLAAAAAIAQLPAPRRSILFMSVSGEEKGLLGSEWWCQHPTVPLERVVADINIDMVGRNDADAVGATPSPAHPDYNTLVARAVELGPSAGLDVTWTAPRDGDDLVDNYYQRSDHYNFASRGIPVVFFFSGVHEDYHRPTDDLERIDREKLRRMTRLITLLARDVANTESKPHALTPEGQPRGPAEPVAPASPVAPAAPARHG